MQPSCGPDHSRHLQPESDGCGMQMEKEESSGPSQVC